VAWPTTQHGPLAAAPVAVCEFGPLPAREQLSPFRSVNVADDKPVVGLRMNWKCVIGVSVPGLYMPSESGQLRSAACQVSESTGMSTCVSTFPVCDGAPPRVVLM